MFRDTHFVLQKNKPTKQAVGCTRNLQVNLWNSRHLDYSELPNIFHRDVEAEYFAKGTENARFLAIYWIKRWKNWKITAVPKFKISLIKKTGFAPVTHSESRPHFTVRSARQRFLVYGLYSFQSCKFCIVSCFVVIYPISFSRYSIFFKLSFCQIKLTKQMTDLKDKTNLGKIVFDHNNQERKSWSCLGQTCSRSLCFYLDFFRCC